MTAYQTGGGRFLDVIDAQRTLLEFELELARARADRGRSAAVGSLSELTSRAASSVCVLLSHGAYSLFLVL